MAAAETSKLVGFRKKDIDKNWAEIVVRVNHLKDRRDVIEVSYPSNRSEPFVVRLNDSIVCEKLLPGSIIKKDCSHKVKHGHKGEVKIKLRKSQPEDWMHRWSPSRETRPPPSITSSSGESSSICNSDHMDFTDVGISDEKKPTFKIEEL